MILKLKYLLLPSTTLNSKQNLDSLNNITSIITNSEYQLKDHLGNTRVTVDNTGKKVQTNNYYPFGMTFATSGNPTNKYLYNGKEQQEETDWLDYGARFYMADIGRWGAQDPLAEEYYPYSPYNYVGGNPIVRIDENGEFWGAVIGAAVDYSLQVAGNMASGKSFTEYLTHDINIGSIVASAATGLVSGGLSSISKIKTATSIGGKILKVGVSLVDDVAKSTAGQVIENGTNDLIENGEVNVNNLTNGIDIDNTAQNVIGSQAGKGVSKVLGSKTNTKQLSNVVKNKKSRNVRINSNTSQNALTTAKNELKTQQVMNVARSVVPEITSKKTTLNLQKDDKK